MVDSAAYLRSWQNPQRMYEKHVKDTYKPVHGYADRSKDINQFNFVLDSDRRRRRIMKGLDVDALLADNPLGDEVRKTNYDPSPLPKPELLRLQHSYRVADADPSEPYYKRYYTKPLNAKEDYFDWDYEGAVNDIKAQSAVAPLASPRHFEYKAMRSVTDASGEGPQLLSPHMFARGSNYPDHRHQNSGYLSGALRSPIYWERRYSKLV